MGSCSITTHLVQDLQRRVVQCNAVIVFVNIERTTRQNGKNEDGYASLVVF